MSKWTNFTFFSSRPNSIVGDGALRRNAYAVGDRLHRSQFTSVSFR